MKPRPPAKLVLPVVYLAVWGGSVAGIWMADGAGLIAGNPDDPDAARRRGRRTAEYLSDLP